MADNNIWLLSHFAYVATKFRASAAADAAWLLLAGSHFRAQPQYLGLSPSCCDIELAMLILDQNPRLDDVIDHVSSLWDQWTGEAKRNQQESQFVLAFVEAYAAARLRQQSPIQSINRVVQILLQRIRNDRSKYRQQQENSEKKVLDMTKTNEGLKRQLEDARRGERRRRREIRRNHTESNERLQQEVDLIKQNLEKTQRKLQSAELQLSCPICRKRERDTALDCGHTFCGSCISRWEPRPEVQNRSTAYVRVMLCPICRKPHPPLTRKLRVFTA